MGVAYVAEKGIVLFAVVVSLTACSGDPKPSTLLPTPSSVATAESPGTPPTLPDLSAIQEPYDLITLSSGEQLVAHQASEKLIADCMSERGFAYTPLPPLDFDAIRRSQGAPTREMVAQFGFVSQRANFSAPNVAEQELSARFDSDPAFSDAYFGLSADGEDGCYVPSASEVFGPDSDTNFQVIQQLVENKVSAFRKVATSTEEYLALEQSWVTCMTGAGYTFASPAALAEVAWPSPRPSQAEIDTALRNFECREQAGINPFIESEVARLQAGWLDESPGFVEMLRVARTQLFERSIAILAAS